jgi:hypothetical protein
MTQHTRRSGARVPESDGWTLAARDMWEGRGDSTISATEHGDASSSTPNTY